MLKAFYYMFKTEKFWLKGLYYMGLVFISNLLVNYAHTLRPAFSRYMPENPLVYYVCIISGSLLLLITLGYIYSCIKLLIDGNENIPYIDIRQDFLKGFKYAISMFSLLLPLLAVVLLIASGIVLVALGSKSGIMVSKIFVMIIAVIFSFLFVAFNRLFAEEPKFSNFYRFKRVFELISYGKRHYTLFVIVIYVIYTLHMYLDIFLGRSIAFLNLGTLNGLIVTGILTAIVETYLMYVVNYLTAKSIKIPAVVNTEVNEGVNNSEENLG